MQSEKCERESKTCRREEKRAGYSHELRQTHRGPRIPTVLHSSSPDYELFRQQGIAGFVHVSFYIKHSTRHGLPSEQMTT
jgi:hypothetical protein